MKLNWNKRKKSEAASKIFRSGVYSAAVTALVLVLVILLNLIVRAIPSRYTEWDLLEAGLYTLSDNSIEVVKNLTQDVKIIIWRRRATRMSSSPSCWIITRRRAAT